MHSEQKQFDSIENILLYISFLFACIIRGRLTLFMSLFDPIVATLLGTRVNQTSKNDAGS